MHWAQLKSQMKYGPQSIRLRAGAIFAIGGLMLVWIVLRPDHPSQIINYFGWTQFLLAIIIGGSLTGWRVTQFPKTRAAEFFLIIPRNDWELVTAEVLSGMMRTSFLMLVSSPLVCAMWGAGWMGGLEAFALLVVPLLCGWTAGLALTAIAYSPVWFRRLAEKGILVMILIYMVVFGLFTQYFVRGIFGYLLSWSRSTDSTWYHPSNLLDYMNPFQLLGSLGFGDPALLPGRLCGVIGLLGGFCLLTYGWLGWRLRRHYWEENYGQQYRRKEFLKPIKENPLAWWTARRVSRFRGNVNLYMGWTTIGLYSSYLIFKEQWPPWLGEHLMMFFTMMGGAAVLGPAALQFGLVPIGFLNGLWDSNQQQRVGRLELLLVTDLTARDFFWGSVVASWTRGKWYFAAATVVWAASAYAAEITWGTFLLLFLCGTIYVVCFFSIAFRNFARLRGDRETANWGLSMTVGIPMVTIGIFWLKWGLLGAFTPLGGLYLLALPEDRQQAILGLSSTGTILLVVGVSLVYLCGAIFLIWTALRKFDAEIHQWFAEHLVSEEVRKETKKQEKLKDEIEQSSCEAPTVSTT
ncbi:Hypothetical protein PBC10988_3970 [Planctomycetales bacterium 10988]|nr:Hypothetical protein PBC10988_3970 [Planctomycetales bacterium 10988]